MKAAITTTYGGPEVVHFGRIDRPEPGPGEMLVRVGAAGVTTADWRLRAAAFPGAISAVAGRLMFGVFRPRRHVLGSDFAGTVEALGSGAAGFAVGDRVFGFQFGGAHAEYMIVKAGGAVTKTPDSLTDIEAAALPFGGLCALEFLDRFAKLQPGERVLIVGASGGVGAYAVQVARALGAIVTGVASGDSLPLVERLGADHVVDYRKTDPANLTGPYDVVFDTVGALDYASAAPMLARGGRFVPLNFGLGDVWKGRKSGRNGHAQILRVNGDTKEGMERLTSMIAAGQLRPVIDTVYPFDDIREAYAKVETRRRKGAVVLEVGAPVTGG
ncbi:zinc-binding dehydrogenase [Rhodobacterales bacterium HKCCSP123]|nr:zinc-binding dehydrogenase [Rhodobacterales bacterium HKCCSP123]